MLLLHMIRMHTGAYSIAKSNTYIFEWLNEGPQALKGSPTRDHSTLGELHVEIIGAESLGYLHNRNEVERLIRAQANA